MGRFGCWNPRAGGARFYGRPRSGTRYDGGQRPCGRARPVGDELRQCATHTGRLGSRTDQSGHRRPCRVRQPPGGLHRQQQRVLLARCVAAQPELVLLDEPFNGLDQPNRDALVRILTDLKNDGVGVVVSTHDLVLAREVCEQVALLAGRQIAFGPRQEVLVPRLVEEAYGSSGSDRLLDLGAR